ncbi:MAG TPA: hypothetical protein VN606_19180 [Thermoleophilaceae bacterium]|nr:hypothetical protein [Thermoleophilaceae bacterium]
MTAASPRMRNQVSTNGTFISVPGAFDGAPEGLLHGPKLEFVSLTNVTTDADNKPQQSFSTAVHGDRALLDFGAVEPKAIDLQRVERDCELLIEAIRDHPDVLQHALATVCGPSRTKAEMNAAAQALSEIGLTEQAAVAQGGGWIAVAVAVVAVLVLAGCEHCSQPIAPEPQVPSSPGPPDGGTN